MKEPGKAQNHDRRQICLREEEERFKERLKELKAGLNGGRSRGEGGEEEDGEKVEKEVREGDGKGKRAASMRG